MLCYAVLYYTILYYTILYYTILYYAICCCWRTAARADSRSPCPGRGHRSGFSTPNLPTKTIPTKIAWLKLSGNFPMGLGIPPLKIQILLESNSLKSRILVRRLAVHYEYVAGAKMTPVLFVWSYVIPFLNHGVLLLLFATQMCPAEFADICWSHV